MCCPTRLPHFYLYLTTNAPPESRTRPTSLATRYSTDKPAAPEIIRNSAFKKISIMVHRGVEPLLPRCKRGVLPID